MINQTITPVGFNPYAQQSNIIPIGQPQQQQFVFAPVIQQQQMQYANPQYDYYNPYGNQQPYNPYYNTQYDPYAGYGNYVSPLYIEKEKQRQKEILLLQLKIADGFAGRNRSDEELNKLITPHQKSMSTKERKVKEAEEQILRYQQLITNTPGTSYGRAMQNIAYNIEQEFTNRTDGVSTFECLTKLFPRLLFEYHIDELRSEQRNLNNSYNTNSYNELLNLHRLSNSYVGVSKYDSNLDDLAIGLPVAVQQSMKLKRELESGGTIISTPEDQERRALFTQSILDITMGGDSNV